MWFRKLMPRNDRFFELFNLHAARVVEGSHAFLAMIQHFDDTEQRARHADAVEVAENAADRITAEVKRLLHRSFITPIDRDQIHTLINRMDDIVDLFEGTSHLLTLYNVTAVDADVVRLAELSARCCERVQHLVGLLPRLRESEVAESALKTCEEIGRLESDADRVMRSAMARLFRDEIETRELIKRKAIYEHLETVSDVCDDVADVVEGIVLENG